MSNSTLLSLFQQSFQSMGIVTYGNPATVIGNTNQDVVQTLALVNIAANQLARENQWEGGTIEYRFTTQFLETTGTWGTTNGVVTGIPDTSTIGAGSTWQATGNGIPQDTYVLTVDSATQVTLSQTPTTAGTASSITFGQTKYTLPTDWDRPVDRTHWDKSRHWEMLGPETAQQWEWLKSGYIATGPRVRFTIQGLYFQIWPMPATNDYLGFEYQSKYWVLATAGTAVSKQYFSADTDTCIFPDALMHALIRLKYWEVKGFDTTAFYRDYQMQLNLAKAHDAGSPTLSFAPRPGTVLITHDNIPDSGYGDVT